MAAILAPVMEMVIVAKMHRKKHPTKSKQESRAIARRTARRRCINFDTYRILQRRRTCGFPATARLSSVQQ